MLVNDSKKALTTTVMRLFMNLCSIIRSDYAQEQRKMRPKVDKKRLKKITRIVIAIRLNMMTKL